MRFGKLQLYDFRNFQSLRVDLRPRINFFLGENGQGKTNFLESICLLCRGSSFRSSDAQSLLRINGSGVSKIKGTFQLQNLDFAVELSLSSGKKLATMNGRGVSSITLQANLPMVLFSPESLAAIKDGPDHRRALLDEVLLTYNPGQGKILREFSKALRSRNRLLKNVSNKIGAISNHLGALESLNKIYFLLATHLSVARIQALRELQPIMEHALFSILKHPLTENQASKVTLDYRISDESAMTWSESQIYDALHKRYLELASRELALGTSLIGPHKHDIKFLFSGKDSRFYCSQGQQRALILALKIGQIVYHHQVHKIYPLLLLDDVMSELDTIKRDNLLKFLEEITAQTLITSTDLTWSDRFELRNNSVFSVANGEIAAVL